MPAFVCERCGHVNEDATAIPVAADQLALVDVPQEEALFATEPDGSPEAGDGGRPASRAVPSPLKSAQSTLDVEAGKPPYRVPTMPEVAEVAENGLTVVSTFSGTGGSCLGFKMAGYRTLMASEFVPAAVDSYRANFPGVPVLTEDVREVTPERVLEVAGLDVGELDVLEGSPPCSSFSTAGRREAGWGEAKHYSDGIHQRTDDLFDEYVRLVAGIKPRVFVAENVAGFLYGAADHFRKWVNGMLDELGYLVWNELLDASTLGVPQRRRRVIIVGVRRDVGLHPADLYPAKLGYRYSFREALEGLGPPTEEELAETSIAKYAIGEEWRKLGPGEQSERYFSLILPNPDEPLPTLTQTAGSVGAASVVHPLEERKLTVREAKRLSAFPDDFVLTGSYSQQIERLGRAVPPLMMRAVAGAVAEGLLRPNRERLNSPRTLTYEPGEPTLEAAFEEPPEESVPEADPGPPPLSAVATADAEATPPPASAGTDEAFTLFGEPN